MPGPKPNQCRHIHLDGHRCGSPALLHEDFCYYHHATRRPLKPTDAQLKQEEIDDYEIPNLEDRHSIQLALTRTLRRLAGNQLHFTAAKLLIYGLQVASQNLSKIELTRDQTPPPVPEIEIHPDHGPIAPIQELELGCPMITDLEGAAEENGDRGDSPNPATTPGAPCLDSETWVSEPPPKSKGGPDSTPIKSRLWTKSMGYPHRSPQSSIEPTRKAEKPKPKSRPSAQNRAKDDSKEVLRCCTACICKR